MASGSAVGFQTLTVSTTALGFAAANYAEAVRAVCTVESQPVRYRLDGTDPTSSVGHLLAAGASLALESPDQIQRVRFIRGGASDGTVVATFFR